MNFRPSPMMSVLLPCLLIAAGGCGRRQQEDPEKILRDMMQASSDTSFSGVKSVEQKVGDQFFRFRMKVAHRAPDHTRLEFLEPAAKRGQVVIARGLETWRMAGANDGPTHFRCLGSQRGMEIRNVTLLLQNYQVQYMGTERVANRTADVIGIFSSSRPGLTRKVWVDKASRLPLQSEESLGEDGAQHVKRYFYEEINFSRRLADDLFKMPMPQGSRSPLVPGRQENLSLEDAKHRAPFTIHLPQYLPRGFVLEQISWLDRQPAGFLHFHYSDGMMALSLFEETVESFHPPGGMLQEDPAHTSDRIYKMRSGAITILHRHWEGTHATLVGEAEAQEMIKMMSSLALCD